MPDFRLWGRIEQIGPDEYVATATAVPENGDPSEVRSLTETHASRELATTALVTLLIKVSASVRQSGGTVIKVETRGP
jgi:hypothetical protein